MTRDILAPRRPRFESLEQKQMLAGDVLVSVVEGALVIEGDALDNAIAVTAGAEAGTYAVIGLEGTNLHLDGGPAASAVVVAGVTGGAKIDLGDGDDLVALYGVDFRGRVAINAGAGDDHVFVGADASAAVDGLAEILPADLGVRLNSSLKIAGGIGNDHVAVADATIRGKLDVAAGLDDDLVELGDLLPVEGLVSSTLHVRGAIGVNLGDGDDELAMAQVKTRLNLLARAGLGDDVLNIHATQALHGFISTDGGNDGVEIVDSVFAVLGVGLGDGDDVLATAGVQAKVALLLGGLGEDLLDELDVSDIVHKLTRGFELPMLDDLLDDLPLVGRLGGLLDRVTDLPLLDHILDDLPLVDRLDNLPLVDKVLDRLPVKLPLGLGA